MKRSMILKEIKKPVISIITMAALIISNFTFINIGTKTEEANAEEMPKETINYDFKEITSVDSLTPATDYLFLSQKYGSDDAVVTLPGNSAVLGYAGNDLDTADFPIPLEYSSFEEYIKANDWLVENYNITTWDELKDLYNNSYGCSYESWDDFISSQCESNEYIRESMKDSCWVNQQDGYVTVEQAGSGFDGCLYGTIGYFTLNDTTAWYYGCYGGGCGNVGPYYLYSFKTAEFTADDVDIKVSDTFNPPDSETVVTTNDVIVIVNVDGNKIKVPFYQISSENNTINPAANDDIITVEVGSIKKDVKLRLRESKPNGVFDSNDEMIKGLVPDNTYIVTCDGVSKEVVADSNGYISAEAYRAKTISLVKKGNEERDDSFAQTIEIPKIEINTIDITDVTMPKG